MIYRKGNDIIIILNYVDNILVTGNNNNKIQTLINHLNSLFALKDLGTLNYFLGIEATKALNSYHLSLTKYIM